MWHLNRKRYLLKYWYHQSWPFLIFGILFLLVVSSTPLISLIKYLSTNICIIIYHKIKGKINKIKTAENKEIEKNESPKVIVYTKEQIFSTFCLRVLVYAFWGFIPATSIIDSSLLWYEKFFIISVATAILSVFEIASEG